MNARMSLLTISALGLLFAACSSSVTIPDPGDDTTPPVVEMTAGAAGETVKADSEGNSDTLAVLSGAEVAVFGSGRDDGGVEVISIEVLSGGTIQEGQAAPTNEIQNQGSESNPRDALYVAGEVLPDGAGTVELQGYARDFSGNDAYTETLKIDYLTPANASLNLSSNSTTQGDGITINWQVTGSNVNGVTLSFPNSSGQMQTQSVNSSGTQSLTVDEPGNYAITVEANTRISQSPSASSSESLQVNPPPQPQASLDISPANVCVGEQVHLSWTTDNADQVLLSPPGNTVSSSGSITQSINSDTTYTLTATDSVYGNSATDQVTASIIQPPDSININKTATTGSGGPGPDNWRTASISTQDITRDCASFTSITEVRYTGSGIPPGESIRIRFEPNSGSPRETRFHPNQTVTDTFDGMDPRGTWKLISTTAPLMTSIPFRVKAE